MTPEKTLQSIEHCLQTDNPITAAKILEEYVMERIVAHEAQKLQLLKNKLHQLNEEPPSPYALEEEGKLQKGNLT